MAGVDVLRKLETADSFPSLIIDKSLLLKLSTVKPDVFGKNADADAAKGALDDDDDDQVEVSGMAFLDVVS